MVSAGLKADDIRVKAATEWIRKNYTRWEENPGMAKHGLFYYYQTFAKTMAVLGAPEFKDAPARLMTGKRNLSASSLVFRSRMEAGLTRLTDGAKVIPIW